jgi:hypothetical protein
MVTLTYLVTASTVTLSLSPTQVQANGTDTTTATVTEVDSDGNAVKQEPPTITASDPGVTVGPVTEIGNGTYRVTLTASTHAGQVTVTATDPGSSASAHATLRQTPGPAANIGVTVNPSTIRADGTSTATVRITVTDAHSNPKPGEPVVISSSDSAEHLSVVTDTGAGTYTATVTSSTQVHHVTLTASDGSLQATRTLIQVGLPTAVLVAVAPSKIVADGKSTATVTAAVVDAAFEAIAGEPVTFSTNDPGVSIGQVTDHGDGTYTATLTSSTTVHQVTVTASDGALTSSTTLTETALAVPPPQLSTTTFVGALAAGSHGALVAIRCSGGSDGHPCIGTVSLTLTRHGGTITLGQTQFQLHAGQSLTMVVALSKQGRQLLKRNHGRLTVGIRLGATQVRTVRLIGPSSGH